MACSPPQLGPCSVQCGTGGDAICPAGSACAVDGFCHVSADEALCDPRGGRDRDGGIIDRDGATADGDGAVPADGAPGADADDRLKLGNPVAFAESADLTPDYLTGFAVDLTTSRQLVAFGFISLVSHGGDIQMALYDDDDIHDPGEPGTRLAVSRVFSDTEGVHEVALTTPVALAPGQYWLFAVTEQRNDVGLDTSVREQRGRYRSWQFGTTPPASFGGASIFSNWHPMNYYIVVR